MPQRGVTSIRTQSGKLNFSKGGSTSIYVDRAASNASDKHDGYSWDRPKKTIQGAIDVLEAWMEIWIKSGTYAENVVIDKENVIIHGLVQSGTDRVEISPVSGVPVDIQVGYCELSGVALVATNSNCLTITGPGHNIHDCYFELDSSGLAQYSCVILNDCDRFHFHDNHLVGGGVLNTIGVRVDGTASASVDCNIHDNFFTGFGALASAGQGINLNNAQRCLITNNIFDSCYNGIYCEVKLNALHTIVGNQFYANYGYDICDMNTDQQTSGINIFNNFYGYVGWYEDYNHDGLADLAVQCYYNVDYAPLSYPHFRGPSFVPSVITW